MNGGAVLAYVWFALMSSGIIPISKGIGAYHIYRKYEMNWSLVTWITLLIKKKIISQMLFWAILFEECPLW